MTVNCSDYLYHRHEAGDEIRFEGAQGTHIDIDDLQLNGDSVSTVVLNGGIEAAALFAAERSGTPRHAGRSSEREEVTPAHDADNAVTGLNGRAAFSVRRLRLWVDAVQRRQVLVGQR